MITWQCPKCGLGHTDYERFCDKCGTVRPSAFTTDAVNAAKPAQPESKLAAWANDTTQERKWICVSCGQANKSTAVKCINCGEMKYLAH